MTLNSDLHVKNILIVDDHSMFREGLAALVNTDSRLRVVAFAGTLDEALRYCRDHPIDCAVVDFNLPDRPGTGLIEYLSLHQKGCRSILLTMHKDPGIRQQALELGASAVVLKDSASDELISQIIRHLNLPGPILEDPILSPREQEVLLRIREGLTSKEIGLQLQISQKTVETYRERIQQKFGVRNTSQLINSSTRYAACHPNHNDR